MASSAGRSSSTVADNEQRPPNVPFFRMRRKPMNTATIRKRKEDDEEEKRDKQQQRRGRKDDGEESEEEKMGGESASDASTTENEEMAPVEAARMKLAERRKHLRGRNLVHTTSKKRRRELEAMVDEEENSSSEQGEEEQGGDGQASFDPDVKFASSGTQRIGPTDMGATARSEVDTDYSRDAQSQFERVQEMLKKERLEWEKREAEEEEDRKKYGERAKRKEEPGSSQTKVYRGMAIYGAKEREDTIKGGAASGLNRLGPIRAQQYMRASVRWDYAPDICKDYKETGFCTFGDSCKFMHDRTDYKHGWEIERDWEAGKLKEAKADEYLVSSSDEGGEEGEDKLPHSCYICRQHFRQPVVTKCKHYFCEECALKHYQRSKKCAVCGEKTDGVFNVAREILAKIKARDEAKANKGDDEFNDQKDDVEEEEAKTLPMAEEAGETVEEEGQSNESDNSGE